MVKWVSSPCFYRNLCYCVLAWLFYNLYLSHLEAMAFFPGSCMPLPAAGWPKALVWCCKVIAPRQGAELPSPKIKGFLQLTVVAITLNGHIQSALNLIEN